MSGPNLKLSQLQAWAARMAVEDPDKAARPLWAQIAEEVASYLEPDVPPDVTGAAALFDMSDMTYDGPPPPEPPLWFKTQDSGHDEKWVVVDPTTGHSIHVGPDLPENARPGTVWWSSYE